MKLCVPTIKCVEVRASQLAYGDREGWLGGGINIIRGDYCVWR